MYCKISGVSRNMKAMLTEFILAEFLSVLVRGLLQRDQRTDLQVFSFLFTLEMSDIHKLTSMKFFLKVQYRGGGADRF